MTAPLCAYEEGLALSAKGQHALAIERYEQALRQSPNDQRTLFALGNTARALGMSLRTVQRDWLKARAWLFRELGGLNQV